MEEEIKRVFESYPDGIRQPLRVIRETIFEVANEENIGVIIETLKWGQPSYMAKHGSTLRLGWNSKKLDEYAMYFHCQSSLVDTFREIYRGVFQFDDNRAVILKTADPTPIIEIKGCISMALRYHQIKHLPMLGAWSVLFKLLFLEFK